jgi:hypothetical protein
VNAAGVNSAAEALAAGPGVTDARELGELIGALPEFCRALTAALGCLDEEVTGRGGPVLEQTGAAVAEMAQHARGLANAAEDAAAVWQEESAFWLGSDG